MTNAVNKNRLIFMLRISWLRFKLKKNNNNNYCYYYLVMAIKNFIDIYHL